MLLLSAFNAWHRADQDRRRLLYVMRAGLYRRGIRPNEHLGKNVGIFERRGLAAKATGRRSWRGRSHVLSKLGTVIIRPKRAQNKRRQISVAPRVNPTLAHSRAPRNTLGNPMSTESVLLISGKPDWGSRFSMECLGLGMCECTTRRGGKAWAGWLPSGALKIRIQGLAPDEIRKMMTAYFSAIERRHGSLSVVEQQVAPAPLPNVVAGDIPWGTVICEKLTRRLLQILPEGAYIHSNDLARKLPERLGPPRDTRDSLETGQNLGRGKIEFAV